MTASPWLCRVDPGADGDVFGLCYDEGIGSPKRTIEKARVVSDVVHRREDTGIDIVGSHLCPQAREASVILLRREGKGLFTLMETVKFWTIHFWLLHHHAKAQFEEGDLPQLHRSKEKSRRAGREHGYACECWRRHRRPISLYASHRTARASLLKADLATLQNIVSWPQHRHQPRRCQTAGRSGCGGAGHGALSRLPA